MKADMNSEINAYLDYIKADYAKWMSQSPSETRERMTKQFIDSVRIEEGSKYIKVITESFVHSFIVKEDGGKFKAGDILKAASWSSPAKNFARGNVLNGNFSVITWTGA
jgi:hypothetical protein